MSGAHRRSPGLVTVADRPATESTEPAHARPTQMPPRPRWQVVLGAVVAALVLLTLGLGWARTWLPDDGAAGAPPGRTDYTGLVLLAGPGGDTVAASLLGHDPARDVGSGILVPSRLLVPVAGRGSMQVGALGSDPEPGRYTADALSDALGIAVDTTWRLDAADVAALVDAVGGISVQLDEPVSTPKGSLPAGVNRFGGVMAAAYAGLTVDGEPDQARLARFSAVLQAVLTGLPTTTSGTRDAVAGVGEQSQPAVLTTLLASLARDASADALRFQSLPVRTVDSGGSTVLALDHVPAVDLVRAQLAPAVLPEPPGGAVRVLVQNGVGTPGLGAVARDRLVSAGLRYAGGGNAPTFGQEHSVVLVAQDTSTDRKRALIVALALGLTGSAVQVAPSGQAMADVVVVLGGDFQVNPSAAA